jgi:hypothetical protein
VRLRMNRRLAFGVAVVAALASATVAARGSGSPNEPRLAQPPLTEIAKNLRAVQLRDPLMYRRMVMTLRATGYLPKSFAVPTLAQARHLASFRLGVLSSGRAPATVPATVGAFVAFASTATNTPRQVALSRLRLLRQDVGARRGDVYAFASDTGGPCFILTGQGGACAVSASGTRGFTWTLGGGEAGVPSSLVGVIADDVARVELVVDGRNVPVGVAKNVAFAEYPATASAARLTIAYTDAPTSVQTIALR